MTGSAATADSEAPTAALEAMGVATAAAVKAMEVAATAVEGRAVGVTEANVAG